ncbi:MAG TPA: universal stress protein [Nitrospiraceae bacterium]|nr:universal stress protein [Nitrospiraceae bacterium]
MKTLLAVDGSDNSYEAVRALKFLSRADQLILLHALNVPRPAYPMMMPEVSDELYKAVERSMREDGERLLDRVQSLLPLHAGPSTKRLETGSPAEVIVTAAEQDKVDLIVMGARGVGPIKERLLGSVSHRILTLAPCAKLIVNGPVKAMTKVLLPLQGPHDMEAAIRFLQLKPFHEPVQLSLLTVLPSVRPPWPVEATAAEQLEERALQSAHEFIEDVANRLRSLGYEARGRAVLGTPTGMILQEAGTLRSDVILMGSRGRKGAMRFMLGSVSHSVLHQMPCPILVFH